MSKIFCLSKQTLTVLVSRWILPLCFVAPAFAQGTAQPSLPSGEGSVLTATVCTQCHSLKTVLMWRAGLPGWKREVEEMVLRGARITPEETETIANYLSEHFGPGPRPSADAKQKPVSLPAGPGKELVEARCALCHDLNRVVIQRKSRQEWEQLTADMIARGPAATPEEIRSIVAYLSSQFGKTDK